MFEVHEVPGPADDVLDLAVMALERRACQGLRSEAQYRRSSKRVFTY
jgi:hypothetical protein